MRIFIGMLHGCLGLYHSPDLIEWVSAIVGFKVQPTPDRDQSSLSVLCYKDAGDHINWHYDHNFYRGRHFTRSFFARERRTVRRVVAQPVDEADYDR